VMLRAAGRRLLVPLRSLARWFAATATLVLKAFRSVLAAVATPALRGLRWARHTVAVVLQAIASQIARLGRVARTIASAATRYLRTAFTIASQIASAVARNVQGAIAFIGRGVGVAGQSLRQLAIRTRNAASTLITPILSLVSRRLTAVTAAVRRYGRGIRRVSSRIRAAVVAMLTSGASAAIRIWQGTRSVLRAGAKPIDSAWQSVRRSARRIRHGLAAARVSAFRKLAPVRSSIRESSLAVRRRVEPVRHATRNQVAQIRQVLRRGKP